MLRQDRHPLPHAASGYLGADNIGKDEVLLEALNGVLLLFPGEWFV
jgi:hypothetical protein